jgi:MFS family permease
MVCAEYPSCPPYAAGSMADIIGRKKIFVTTAVLICIGSFGSACCGNTPAFTIYGQLACWR